MDYHFKVSTTAPNQREPKLSKSFNKHNHKGHLIQEFKIDQELIPKAIEHCHKTGKEYVMNINNEPYYDRGILINFGYKIEWKPIK